MRILLRPWIPWCDCLLCSMQAQDCSNEGKARPCALCAQFGHSKANCPSLVCFKCNRTGHIARDCPHSYNSRCVSSRTPAAEGTLSCLDAFLLVDHGLSCAQHAVALQTCDTPQAVVPRACRGKLRFRHRTCSVADAASAVCLRCGLSSCRGAHADWARAEGACTTRYSAADVALAVCFVCGRRGHLCCASTPSATYRCRTGL